MTTFGAGDFRCQAMFVTPFLTSSRLYCRFRGFRCSRCRLQCHSRYDCHRHHIGCHLHCRCFVVFVIVFSSLLLFLFILFFFCFAVFVLFIIVFVVSAIGFCRCHYDFVMSCHTYPTYICFFFLK